MFKKFTCWLLAVLVVLSLCVIPAAAETTTLPGTGSAAGKTVTLSVTPRTPKVPYSTEDTYVTFDITITPPERRKIAAFSFALAEPTDGMTLATPEGNWWKLNSAALAKHYAQVSFSPSYTRYFGAGGSINGGISEATRVMSVTAKIPANTAPGDYYLRVVTEGDEIDVFTAGLKNGDQYSREVIYTPVTVVAENGIHGRILGTGDESVTYALYRDGSSDPVQQGSAIDELYLFGVDDGTYRLEISGGNIITRSVNVTVNKGKLSIPEIRVAQYGDVNGTGEVDISDVACLYEYLTTNENSGTLSDDYLEEVADLNSDDAVDVYDLQFLYEVVSGISSIGKQPGGADNVVKIGVFEPTSGQNAAGGKKEILGIEYANSLKPTVTIKGKEYPVQLVYSDNRSDPAKAPAAAQSLINQGVSAVIGSYGSGCSIAVGKLFESSQIPIIGASCTNPLVTIGNNYYFRICYVDPFQGVVMANFAFNEKNSHNCALIIESGDDYSAGFGNYFQQEMNRMGGKAVTLEFQSGETDFSTIMASVKAEGYDGIFAPVSIETAAMIISQARNAGITCPIMAGDTWDDISIVQRTGDNATEIFFSTFFDAADTKNEAGKAFVKGFKTWVAEDDIRIEKNGGTAEVVSSVTPCGYDAYMAAISAIEKANSAEGAAIRDALADLEISGLITGDLKFDENGDAIKNYAVIKTIENGDIVYYSTFSGLNSDGGNENAETSDAQKLANALKNNVHFNANMIIFSAEDMNYILEPPAGTELAGYRADDTSYDMIVVGQCVSEEDAKTLYANMKVYLSDLINEAVRYQPESVPLLDAALLCQIDNLSVLCISNDTSAAAAIIESYQK